jgi:hypothetical protein
VREVPIYISVDIAVRNFVEKKHSMKTEHMFSENMYISEWFSGGITCGLYVEKRIAYFDGSSHC